MKLSEQIEQVRNWMIDHERHLTHGWRQDTRAHFKAQLVELTNAIETAKEQEAAIHSSWEFFSGEWEPDDGARHRLTLELAELAGEEAT